MLVLKHKVAYKSTSIIFFKFQIMQKSPLICKIDSNKSYDTYIAL